MVDENEVLEYAKRIKEERPETSKDEMRKLLEAKFLHDKDVLVAGLGVALRNPMQWIRGTGKVVKGAASYVTGDKDAGKEEMIKGALQVLYG